MNTTDDTASEQTALWNGAAGHAWVEAQQVLDRLFTPFEDLLVAAVRAARRARCSTSAAAPAVTTLAAARALDADGRCLGIDLSEPMSRSPPRSRCSRAHTGRVRLRRCAECTCSSPAAWT